ncbi:cytochrome P450 [Xylaria telfairii]|nr:cytochrome P450 [Xylaria telfairii]
MDNLMLVAASVAGVVSHLAIFRVGEHHMHGHRYLWNTILAFALSTIVQSRIFQFSGQIAALRTLALAAAYFSGLYSSLCIFRVFFHPLKKFPGPLGSKVSSAWFSTHLTGKDAFRQIFKWHQKHGNFLRYGSNDLSIAHPGAVPIIYGLNSKCRKSDWYDLTNPMVSLHTTRDDALHSKRRRLWSAVFGDKHLRDYEGRMVRYRALLVKAIEDSDGLPIDISKWFNLYSFDVMGDLAFGHSFDMLKTNKEHHAIKLLNSGLAPLSFDLPAWMFRFLVAIPGAAKSWWGFLGYCNSQLDKRIQEKVEITDIMGGLLKPLKGQNPTGLDRARLMGDVQLIVVAGSDTTTSTLTTVFRYLAQYPQHVERLRAEIDPLQRTEAGDYIYSDLSNLQHLNGVINEALRLFPPVPTSLPRLTPPEGLHIDGTFIPGNTTVICPQYVIGRSPEAYSLPNEFIPERWYSQPELIHDRSGFAPFSMGPYGCVGRPLALVNIRATISRIVADYDIQSIPVESLVAYDEGMTEHFTLECPELQLTFAKRPRP